ncbi:MAG TPA: methionyl-tRNA formyltransferase [Chloroflexota bacterium]
MARVVFMGTPEFAVPTLRGLLEAKYEVVLVVSQPDRPVGRRLRLTPPPVAQLAREIGLPLVQPTTLRDPSVQERLRASRPDVIVVVAYGRILPRAVLGLPPRGCLNVHASLLPRWRGAAPIQAAILAGDEETGVTIMLMDEGLDTGPVLAQRATPIADADNAETLERRLALMGRDLLLETLPRWLDGTIQPRPQDERLATVAPPVAKEQGLISWDQPAVQIWRQVRAMYGWPGAYTFWHGRLLKVLAAEPRPNGRGLPPGQTLVVREDRRETLAVATGQGVLVLREVQPEGGKRMDAAAFLRGHPAVVGSVLGERQP